MYYLCLISLLFLIFLNLNCNSQIKGLNCPYVKTKSHKKEHKSDNKYSENKRQVIPKGIFRQSAEKREKAQKNKPKKGKVQSNVDLKTKRQIRKEKLAKVKEKKEREKNKTVVYSEKKRGIKHKRNIWGRYKKNKEKKYKKPKDLDLFPPEIKNRY